MKLRNKKTGEIGDLVPTIEMEAFRVVDDEWNIIAEYATLADLNEEWEDHEELFWYMDSDGQILCDPADGSKLDIGCKQIGNYFETKEDAEKAVEKLKAWKRLKDKGIIFEIKYSRYTDEPFTIIGELGCIISDKDKADLDLLFGAEE